MQPTTMLPKLTDTTQTISFSDDDEGCMTEEVFASDVVVTTSAGTHSHGSSKAKLKSLVDYNWEPKLYSGQLLAAHLGGQYLAYCIKAPNAVNPGSWCGMVRVVYNPEPGSDRRALIKGMKGEVQDLSFAHIQSQVVLACIDEQGNFYVHEIEVTDSGLRCTLIAEIREDTGLMGSSHRVVWCPYIPDDDDDVPDEDVARLLLTTHANVARMWNMGVIARTVAGAGAGAGAGTERVGSARALVESAGGAARGAGEHAAAIVDAAFSPDGTALATAAADGYVMFFQVYMHSEGSPRCLHKWQPHGGKPLSCLFFLDNHRNYNTDVQFWKFAVTGAESNTVIKIWSCKSWNCLQTISFTSTLGPEAPTLGLKAMLDTSASYLLLSDFRARSLYVLNMARDKDDTTAYCKSISEFLLPYPVLSFCIVDAEEEQVKCSSSCSEPYHHNGSSPRASPDEFEQLPPLPPAVPPPPPPPPPPPHCAGRAVRLRLYIVQPKGLQEGELTYTPPTPRDLLRALSDLALDDKSDTVAIPSSILQQQSQQLKNLLMRSQTQPGSLIGQRPESPGPLQLNLMTPDAFSSPGKRDEDDPPLSATPDVSKPRSTCDEVQNDSKLISGGSSPSREVQQIMSHNEDYYKDKLETPVAEEDGSSIVQNGMEPFENDDDIFASPEKQPDTAWPQISLQQITEANQRKASSDKSSSQSLNAAERAASDEARGPTLPAPLVPTVPVVTAGAIAPPDRARLEVLEHKLDKLCDLVMQQSREIRSLRSEVSSPREAIDEALHAHSQRTTAAIESALADGWERWARVGETAANRAATAAGVGAARALEPLAAALQHELAAKLSATDRLLRDNIDKLASSKTIMERLSTSIAKSLSDMVRESFRAALFDSVVPVMEKAHAQIFRQINHAFQTGTKEFAANTEAAARAAAERGGAAAAASLRAALERHSEQLASSTPPAALLQQTLRQALDTELARWRQLAVPPSPCTVTSHDNTDRDRQMQMAQIQSLMAGGDINGAFQLALSASDLQLVMSACRGAEPGAVFGPPCKLKQHVLLSLVQQLAADMPKDTHLKHRYLEEAVMNLDTSNPVTREHLPAVVRELQKQIVSFLNTSPSHALARQFRMLLMAADSLVSSSV